jgi:hypothetical protein
MALVPSLSAIWQMSAHVRLATHGLNAPAKRKDTDMQSPMRTVTMDALEWQIVIEMLEDLASRDDSYHDADSVLAKADDIFRQAGL